MITIKIILIISAILYYLFCTFLIITYLEDECLHRSAIAKVGLIVLALLISPLAVPIILGISIGGKLGE